MKFRSISWGLIIIIAVAIFFRFFLLDKIPVGATNDELDYIINAKAVFLHWSDISNIWNPLSLTTPTSSFPQAEIPPLLLFWIIGPLPLSLFTTRLPYALVSVGTVIIIYFLAKRLIGEKEALLAGIVAAINPWLIFFGRTAYDVSLALFFYLIGFYIIISTKKWKIFWALPFFFLAFYSYIGTKLLFLPFIFIILLFSWITIANKKDSKIYALFFVACFAIFSFYLFTFSHTGNTRTNELATPNMALIKQTTDSQRQLTIHQPLTNLFSNKYVVFSEYAFEKYINVFSPDFLFLHGDSKIEFSLFDIGVFYYIDIVFLLIGIYAVFVKQRKIFYLLTALTLIAPLPSVASDVGTSYAVRSILLCPILLIFTGVGISTVIFTPKNKKYRAIIQAIIALAYLILSLNFFNIYFFRNPIDNAEASNFSARILVKYLTLTKSNVYVIGNYPQIPLKQYLFYANAYNANTYSQVADMYKTGNYKIKNISFITCSTQALEKLPINATIIYDSSCTKIHKSRNDLFIPQLKDGGTLYTISHDTTCSQYKLGTYPHDLKLTDFSIESLSSQQFCQTFITKF